MADRAIQFTISTVDRATATINKINTNIARMTRPYQNLAKSAQRFSKASGLAEVGKRLGNVAQRAEKAAKAVTKIGAPLLAIVGGGTLAGLSEMVTHWERIGAETERTSRLLGITANQLTQMRGAASLVGVSAETMTSGFQSLQDTLQDARWGRNQAAFATLQALGVTLKQTRTGTVDTQAAMYDLADRIQRIQRRDPAAARNLARSLGVEQLLPVLVQGRQGMQAYEAEARRLRGDMTPEMAQRAQAFALSLSKMGLAADGLKQTIADRLVPVLQPLIDHFTEWIAKNRELISQKVAAVVQRIADALQKVDWDALADSLTKTVTSIIDFIGWIAKIVSALGGVKGVAIAFGLYMTGGFIGSLVSAGVGIATFIGKIGALARAWSGASTAASTAAEAIAGASTAAEGVGGAAAGAAGRGLLARALPWLVNPATVGAGLMLHSEGLNTGEDKELARIRAAETAAGGQWPGSPNAPAAGAAAAGAGIARSVQTWAKQLDFAALESRYKLPAGLLSAVAQQESGGNAGAVSRAGAAGLFQFMPATAREYGINALDPAQSANAAAKKLGGLVARYHGNLTATLSAYNWGEGNLDRKGLANAPAETRAYAPAILARMGATNSGVDMPPLNVLPTAVATNTAPPVVHVSNQIHVARDGGTTIRTETPSGLKISRPMDPA
ncbi:putative Membrane-bound lytic murein transglycosylase D [Burkholderia diffusa]|uniref:lytic transglycosylase domain-containing protein n=1 Tax=Burkholderia diffusa TaxID=488732 RepID=UPI001CAF6BB8|nr:lytic transglycosylase domain-containing protein [Burkholderia diffusa]CAG9250192.1 putative Membrane-bound lytic murein transglycosylase D [Burkholderia diffusa]